MEQAGDNTLNSTRIQYRKLVEFDRWKASALTELNSYAKALQGNSITPYKWNSAVTSNVIDSTNFPGEQDDIYASLIHYLASMTDLSYYTINVVLVGSKSDLTDVTLNLATKVTSLGDYTKIEVGDKHLRIQSSLVHRDTSDDQLARLMLRYYPMSPDTTYYTSMSTELYNMLESDGTLTTLECFASPFNYSCRYFCSLFKEDTTLIYPNSQCVGNFFDVIRNMTGPTRLLFNPPYTVNFIVKSTEALIKYLDTDNGSESEVIAMLPNWYDTKGLDDLKAYEGSVYEIVEPGSFFMYNFNTMSRVQLSGISMVLLVNSRRDPVASRRLLDMCLNNIDPRI